MLPVSSYEELLARVRSLTSETIQLRHEISSSLQTPIAVGSSALSPHLIHDDHHSKNHSTFLSGGTFCIEDTKVSDLKASNGKTGRATFSLDKNRSEIDEKLTSPNGTFGKDLFNQNGWSCDSVGLWHSGPSSLNFRQTSNNCGPEQDLTLSVMSDLHEPQSMSSFSSSSKKTYSHQQLGAKVEMVYSLLSMLDTDNREDMSKTFLAMSSTAESCHAMRQNGCLPLLIQLIHSSELNKEVRKRAAETLHNIVHAQTDEKRRRREIRVLKLLQQVREYCDELKNDCAQEIIRSQEELEKHPINAIGTLMKFSFDAEHRQSICVLGGLQALTQLLQIDHEAHGSTNNNPTCITLRRYTGMSLTNLTFGDGKNKSLLCSFSKFMRALVDQLKSPSEDLRQVTASVLRNLSWRADSESKQALRDVGAVTALTVSAMEGKKESTLKSILSALWNLSAHCSLNKIDICSVSGALPFLVKMMRYKSSSNTLSVVENAGGILRNISSHIAVREDYRQILRDNNCFEVLLEQLKSPSLTVVSNACGTLWNLSARCPEDQKRLWEMGATTMLRSLVQSKHKMISMGSSAALKNLLAANPEENLLTHLDSTAKSLGFQNLPTLFVRKKRALEQELNITLAETCENIDLTGSPTHSCPLQEKILPKRSESRDSIQSSQSDSICERVNQITLKSEEKVVQNKNITLHVSLDEKSMLHKAEDQKLMKRYKTSMIPTSTFKKLSQDRINEKTKEESVLKDRANEWPSDNCLKTRSGPDSIVRNKKGISVLDIQIKKETNQSYEASNGNFMSRSNDDSREGSFNEKCQHVARNHSSSDPYFQVDKEIRIKTCKSHEKIEQDPEILMKLRDVLFSASTFSNEKVSPGDNYLVEGISAVCKNEITNECPKSNDGKFIIGEVSDEEEIFSNNLNSLKHPHEFAKPILKENLSKVGASNKIKKSSVREDCSDLSKEIELKKEIFRLNQNFASVIGTFHIPKNRLRYQKPGFVPSSTSMNLSEQNCSLGASALEDCEKAHRVTDFETIDLENLESTFPSSNDGSRILDNLKVIKCSVKPEQAELTNQPKCNSDVDDSFCDKESLSNIQVIVDPDIEVRTQSDNIFPKFKVGFPITDSSILQMEANKICHEIKKQQDSEMGCSLTSEVSLVSCSSFLDTGDYSLFDSSSDVVDFDESENMFLSKTFSKIRSFSYRRPNATQTAESESLPSLGSCKNEQSDTLDLDNSVLSVASITSEVAETFLKNSETFNTFIRTQENIDGKSELVEETLADVTLLSNGDDTLNADSLQNNTEFYDEDNSLHSQENLPLDSETSLEKAPELLNKKLTPKEKRKIFHERYKTYTIRDHQGSNCSGNDFVSEFQELEIEEPSAWQGNRTECNNVSSDEWKKENFDQRSEFEQKERNNERQNFNLLTSNFQKGIKHGQFCFSKSFDREHNKTMMQEFVLDSKSLNNLLSIGPAERKELVDNAKLVAFSLKTAIQEGETLSDGEGESDSKSFEIDTATYNKNHRDCFLDKFRSQELHSLEPCNCVAEVKKKGRAKILNPNDKTEETVELSKSIRGRRKPLYSSYKKNLSRVTNSSLNSPKISKIAMAQRKPLTDTWKSELFNREETFTKEDISDVKKTKAKDVRTPPILHRNFESKVLNSSRLFSKTKPKPPVGNSKQSCENEVSKIVRPLSTYAFKNIERRAESNSSQKRSLSVGAGIKIECDKSAMSTGIVSSSSTTKMRSPLNNQNIKTGTSSGSGLSVKSRNLTLQSSGSQSDASFSFVAPKDKNIDIVKVPKKEVTSKIASLWRKVEETKQRTQNFKDDRVWICPKKKAVAPDEVAIDLEREEVIVIPTKKIVHSFTSQGLANETSTHLRSQATDFNNGKEFSHVRGPEVRRGKIEKRNIISAVIPPFNYSPPAGSQILPPKIQQVDSFVNGSLKVTTV